MLELIPHAWLASLPQLIEPVRVSSDASARLVSVVIVCRRAVSAASARAVSVATEVLEAVTSLKKASSCTLLEGSMN